jgi:hypothetical protein
MLLVAMTIGGRGGSGQLRAEGQVGQIGPGNDSGLGSSRKSLCLRISPENGIHAGQMTLAARLGAVRAQALEILDWAAPHASVEQDRLPTGLEGLCWSKGKSKKGNPGIYFVDYGHLRA